ncbi:MAG TPA: DUF547 domain-containing protein [Ignavibacteriaceae bacterium]|nr:DUF547 domain-containing protein [Ignavibacteriaceae bacterium]
MKRRNVVLLTVMLLLFMLTKQLSAQEHQLLTDVLKKYVINGLVDYEKLTKDKQLDKYLEQLTNTNPDKLNKNQKLAFWINSYNAYTLQIIRDNYPIKSINELHTGGKIIAHIIGKTVWDKEFITINNKKYSLNDIEHKILRKMNEPRIHFAIVCASNSCPELGNEAFEADRIDAQLQEQTAKFLNDKTRNHFDLKNRKAYISEIFNWFGEDFGNSDENILKFIAKYVPEKITADINKNLSKWDISFNDYDWNLNEIK